ncbi:MAG: MotA/TolQ/ExbB proton channel family protein [Verrucomicrobia bacterium]|nr:MotA/TolQ/ExbB proton channel family protein [Verrucomicrobiota bacterium]
MATALARTQQDIIAASAALQATRDAIAQQRIPLAAQLATLQHEIAQLRTEADRRRAIQRQGEQERQARADQVRTLEADANFIFTALQEYRRAMETRLGPASPNTLSAELVTADRALGTSSSAADLPSGATTLLDLAARENLAHLGGTVFPGTCLDADGREHAGRFVVAGPLTYFVGDAGGPSGIVGRRVGSANPALLAPFAGASATAARRVADGDTAPLPVDVSGGEALRASGARGSLCAHVCSGGVMMIPLAGVGLLATVLTLSRLIALRRIHPPSLELLDPIVQRLTDGDAPGAQAAALAIQGPAGELLREGIRHHTATPEALEEIMHERMLGIVPTLDRHLSMLAVLGGAAPLLGLLGTVTGIMHTFRLITIFGSGDARLLSSGIAEALVATQTGLFIAIPIVLIHAYLARRVRTILTGLEQVIVAFVNRSKPTA